MKTTILAIMALLAIFVFLFSPKSVMLEDKIQTKSKLEILALDKEMKKHAEKLEFGSYQFPVYYGTEKLPYAVVYVNKTENVLLTEIKMNGIELEKF